MQMKKTCIIKTLHLMMQMKNMYYKNIALDDVDEKTCIIKNNIALENEDEKNSIIKNIALDDVDEKNMYYKKTAHLKMKMKKTVF